METSNIRKEVIITILFDTCLVILLVCLFAQENITNRKSSSFYTLFAQNSSSIYFTLPFVGSSFIHQCAPNLSTAALTTALWLKGVMVSLLQREETKKLKLSPTTSLTLRRAWSLSWVPSNRLQPRRPRHEEAAQPPWKYNEVVLRFKAKVKPPCLPSRRGSGVPQFLSKRCLCYEGPSW